MTIGLALAGIAAVALAAHPSGARSLMGLMGTPEEHLAKFREYLEGAANESFPHRIRVGFVDMAWAESGWTTVPEDEKARLVAIQNDLEAKVVQSLPLPSFAPVRSNLVAKRDRSVVDPRHPPAGWKRTHTIKGATWFVVSNGNGNYTMTSMSTGVVHTGTGNTVLTKVHGYTMDVYNTFKLGKPGARFDENNPAPGWSR
jgi:hypothetical protein